MMSLALVVAALLAAPHAVVDVAVRLTPAEIAPAKRVTVAAWMRSETTGETLAIALPLDGAVDPATDKTLARFFRHGETGRTRPIAPGALALLARIAAEYPGRRIDILSATRPGGRGARRSKHVTGHAIDLRVDGVSAVEVRDFVWSLDGEIGVGHCRARGFVHIDHRPGEPKIGWDETSDGRPSRYSPRWTRLRRDRPNS